MRGIISIGLSAPLTKSCLNNCRWPPNIAYQTLMTGYIPRYPLLSHSMVCIEKPFIYCRKTSLTANKWRAVHAYVSYRRNLVFLMTSHSKFQNNRLNSKEFLILSFIYTPPLCCSYKYAIYKLLQITLLCIMLL